MTIVFCLLMASACASMKTAPQGKTLVGCNAISDLTAKSACWDNEPYAKTLHSRRITLVACQYELGALHNDAPAHKWCAIHTCQNQELARKKYTQHYKEVGSQPEGAKLAALMTTLDCPASRQIWQHEAGNYKSGTLTWKNLLGTVLIVERDLGLPFTVTALCNQGDREKAVSTCIGTDDRCSLLRAAQVLNKFCYRVKLPVTQN